jgi:hypothetical protein
MASPSPSSSSSSSSTAPSPAVPVPLTAADMVPLTAEEQNTLLESGMLQIKALMQRLHYQNSGGVWMLPQTPRVRAARMSQVQEDPVIHFTPPIWFKAPDVALVRYTLGDICGAFPSSTRPDAATERALFISVMGAERFAREETRAHAFVADFAGSEALGGTLFDPVAGGPLFEQHLAHIPFASLTQDAVQRIRATFQIAVTQRRAFFHHIVDNVAALCMFLPMSDVLTPGDLIVILTEMVQQGLWALSVEAAEYRRLVEMAPADMSRELASYVLEYHVAMVQAPAEQEEAPTDGSPPKIFEGVPHCRVYLRLVPPHIFTIGARRALREQLEETQVSTDKDTVARNADSVHETRHAIGQRLIEAYVAAPSAETPPIPVV